MTKFTTNELDRMRNTQIDAMQDMGVIQDYTPLEVSGESQPAWTERTEPTVLGLNMFTDKSLMKRRELHRADMDVVVTDGQIRLPLGVLIEAEDRIRIFERYGQPVSEMIIAVASAPLEGSSGITVDFRIVEPGANR